MMEFDVHPFPVICPECGEAICLLLPNFPHNSRLYQSCDQCDKEVILHLEAIQGEILSIKLETQ